MLGVVGESGSGKSVTMLALMGLVRLPGPGARAAHALCRPRPAGLSPRERRRIVGKDVAMIFQDPTTSLNPCFTIGFQIAETLRLHLKLDGRAAQRRARRAAGAGRHPGGGQPPEGLSRTSSRAA